MAEAVYAWAVKHKANEHHSVVHARTRGGAVAEYLRDVRDCWPDVQFTDLRAKKIGAPITSDRLKRVAKYRGMPWVRAGMRVTVCGDMAGVVVDGNESANFEVLLDGGHTVNCHPHDLKFQEAPAHGF